MIKKIGFDEIREYSEIRIDVSAKGVDEYNFYNADNIYYVHMPEGLTYVGKYAFSDCTYLFRSIMPNSLLKVGEGVFKDCENLEYVKYTSGVSYIPQFCFEGCTKLSYVAIPDNITTINNNAFKNCKSLTNIKLPKQLQEIGSEAFYGCESIDKLYLEKDIRTLSDNSFSYCTSISILSIECPNLTSISSNAFANCTSIKYISITGQNFNTIGGAAFKNCYSLSEIHLPGTLTKINNNAFVGCYNLSKIYFNGYRSEWNAVSKYINFTKDINSNCEIICKDEKSVFEYKDGELAETTIYNTVNWGDIDTNVVTVRLSESVSRIGNRGFMNCTELTDVYLSSFIRRIDEFAFFNCNNLQRIHYDGTAKQWKSVYLHKCKGPGTDVYYNEWRENAARNYGKITIIFNDGTSEDIICDEYYIYHMDKNYKLLSPVVQTTIGSDIALNNDPIEIEDWQFDSIVENYWSKTFYYVGGTVYPEIIIEGDEDDELNGWINESDWNNDSSWDNE